MSCRQDRMKDGGPVQSQKESKIRESGQKYSWVCVHHAESVMCVLDVHLLLVHAGSSQRVQVQTLKSAQCPTA